MSLNESIVEDAALEWFLLRHGYGGQAGELDYAIGHGPHLAPSEPAADRGVERHRSVSNSGRTSSMSTTMTATMPLMMITSSAAAAD